MGNPHGLSDAEQAHVDALRSVRARLMDIITGLDDTIADVVQFAAARAVVIPTCRCGRNQGAPHPVTVHQH